MKYRSIRAWFDYGNRQSGTQPVPECGKVESSSGPDEADRGADGSHGASPDRPAPAFLFQPAAKRAFDIAVAVIGLIVFSPILLLSSLAIKLDSRGPIVCHQVCHGHD
jgi:hypothetical protein